MRRNTSFYRKMTEIRSHIKKAKTNAAGAEGAAKDHVDSVIEKFERGCGCGQNSRSFDFALRSG